MFVSEGLMTSAAQAPVSVCCGRKGDMLATLPFRLRRPSPEDIDPHHEASLCGDLKQI